MDTSKNIYQKQIIIASNNAGKIRELKQLLPNYELLSLNNVGFVEEITEPYETFEENAQQKARTVYEFCGKTTIADDSGLCVPVLNDAPGVHSAYYGGHPRSDEKNNQHLLEALNGKKERTAYYKAVICLYGKEGAVFFEGTCEGTILETPQGEGGFGYDPLFVPNGFTQTFAQLSPDVKNKISHRGKAVEQLKHYLNSH
jgi:XTP/dITP diphosphohydrolase